MEAFPEVNLTCEVLESGFYVRPESSAPTHARTVMDVELDLFVSGSAFISVEGVKYPVEHGVLMIRLPGQHCFSDGPYSCATLTLNFTGSPMQNKSRHRTGDIQRLPLDFPLRNAPTTLRPADFAVYEELFHSIRIFQNPTDAALRETCVAELLYRIFADSLRAENHAHAENRASVLHPAVRAAMLWMDTHYREHITLETVGTAVGFHPRYLHRIFRENMGDTPMQYLSHLRLSHARRLLRDTSDPIDWVSAACGFSSASYFAQSFQREYGMSPSAYRKSV